MSSMSESKANNHYEHCHNNDKASKFTFKCGDSGQGLLTSSPPGTSATVATITIDTSEFCNPCTKLEFTSNIIGVFFIGNVNFQIYKNCNQQQSIPIGSVFSYQVTVLADAIADDFSFFICDCDSCSKGCCTYSVVVTAVGEQDIVGNVGVFAARLIATTVDNPKSC